MRGWIYDRTAAPVTASWYAAALDRVPDGAHLLDVGIGTGRALAIHAERLREHDLRVTGLDIDPDYVRRCRQRMRSAGLADRVAVREESFLLHGGGPYDVVCFSASFMLMPDQNEALDRAVRLLLPGGRIMFTQTFEERRSRWIEWIKPRLRLLTTIDFGRVTYADDFYRLLLGSGLVVEETLTLSSGRRRSFKLVLTRPAGQAQRNDRDGRSPA